MNKEEFDAYIRELPPEKMLRGHAWYTALDTWTIEGHTLPRGIYDIAKKNIEGEIFLDEVTALIEKAAAEERGE
ncbi:MAG: hypothetical protein K6F13_07475 [Lachnospiraceae bacterium]|nr:hypothetical protein [Lachnospiraceae bacterium]MBQ1515730.1 hypothetical protein [Lachnospiraceae bacterium]MBQ4309116.1 hypothetical protein [Lachnospiraceae bacterium]MCR5539098.1 hypothetical protein [Lachnospiraceae bacterium]